MTKTAWAIMVLLAIVVAITSAWLVVDGASHLEEIDKMKAEIAANTQFNRDQEAALEKRVKAVDAEQKRVDMQLDAITKAIQELEKDVKSLNDRVWR